MANEKLAEILNYFDAVELNKFEDTSFVNDPDSIGKTILINSIVEPLLPNAHFDIALFGVNRYFNKKIAEKNHTPSRIREELYKLKKTSPQMRIADLGNIKTGKSYSQTLMAIEQVCSMLFYLKKTIIIIGGSNQLSVGVFNAFKEFENNINVSNIDAKIDIETTQSQNKEWKPLNRLVEKERAYIYNISCIGYQQYFTGHHQIETLNKHYFEHYRLGAIRDNFHNIEPVLRDTDLAQFNISSIRMSEAPGQANGSPNGFYADEACRLARYSGLSDRLKAFGLFDIDSTYDQNKQTIKLAAQIIWHFIEGFIHRKNDYPIRNIDNYIKFEVQIDEIDFPIVFYKNETSERWWLEIKSTQNTDNAENTTIVACTEDDYKSACQNEIPERWWLNFKKMK